MIMARLRPLSNRSTRELTMATYKILTERDRLFAGNFDGEKLEAVLNEQAADGWRVVSAFQTENIWKTSKTTIMIILEHA
jgi:hypothetical protein